MPFLIIEWLTAEDVGQPIATNGDDTVRLLVLPRTKFDRELPVATGCAARQLYPFYNTTWITGPQWPSHSSTGFDNANVVLIKTHKTGTETVKSMLVDLATMFGFVTYAGLHGTTVVQS